MAEHVAHTTDVDAMLDGMTPRQFDEWCAKDLIEPIGSDRAVVEVVAKIGEVLSAACGARLLQKDFAPWMETEDEQPLTAQQAASVIPNLLKMKAGMNGSSWNTGGQPGGEQHSAGQGAQ